MTTSDSKISFDPEAHEYRYDGKVLLSVTQMLEMAGLIFTRWFTKLSAIKGSVGHLITQLVDEGGVDESTIDPEIEGYYRAYLKFKEECGPKWTHIETMYADPHVGVAGTVDRVGSLLAPGESKRKRVVLDIKTGAPQPWHAVQLAGYKHLASRQQILSGADRSHAGKQKRFGLYLKKNGKYALTEYSDRRDEAIFMAAVSIANYRLKHGLLET
jgi:hypothetical protein